MVRARAATAAAGHAPTCRAATSMRYKFLLQLYSLRFDKHEFERDFGVSVERGLPVEMAFMRRQRGVRHRQRRRADADPGGARPGGGAVPPVPGRSQQPARAGPQPSSRASSATSCSATARRSSAAHGGLLLSFYAQDVKMPLSLGRERPLRGHGRDFVQFLA